MGTMLHNFLMLYAREFSKLFPIVVITVVIVNTPLSTFLMFQFFMKNYVGNHKFECLPKNI